MRMSAVVMLFVALCVSAGSCRSAGKSRKESGRMEKSKIETITVTSSAFLEGEMIPTKYTCDGPDLSPPLAWSKVPRGTASLALICEDPDAPRGIWVHWVVWGLPADSTSLPEAVTTDRILSTDARQGKNDFGKFGYGGPCPPPGKPHRYYYRLYALDHKIPLDPGATRKDLLAAMEGHVIGEGALMGRYGRVK